MATNSLQASEPQTQSQPFHLLDLPAELKHNIYRSYFGEIDVLRLDYAEEQQRLRIRGCPSLNVEQLCQELSTDVRKARTAAIPTTLHVSDVEFIGAHTTLFAESESLEWVRNHVRILHMVDQLIPGPDAPPTVPWSSVLRNCPNLEKIYIQPATVDGDIPHLDELLQQGHQYEDIVMYSMHDFVNGQVDVFTEEILEDLDLRRLAEMWEKSC
ncbi:hypothetical protein PMZ80_008166 [Knufia obscura]|uniref:Uncharacterized protein n=2 Tax=Knufia TaxID=430999 RepID=A0AAN8I6Q5_9EURO|nr:hypothetical protein PMZ80_008166 [Knufia obscura]KAK5957107.1 hypothetical protein OHC33_001476 [Knufia fluminis]